MQLGTRWVGRACALGALLLVTFLLPANKATADDLPRAEKLRFEGELKLLASQLKAAQDKKDAVEIKRLLREVVGFHKQLPEGTKLRRKALKLIGKQAKPGKKNAEMQIRVLDALGKTGDPDAGFEVRRWLKQKDPKQITPPLRRAIETAAKVPHTCLVKPLLALVQKSKNGAVATSALTSLGFFKSVKRRRAQIFFELCSTIKKDKPGQAPDAAGNQGPVGLPFNPLGQVSSGNNSRYNALAPLLPKALSQLTGRDLTGAEECFALATRYKTKSAQLFIGDEAEGDASR